MPNADFINAGNLINCTDDRFIDIDEYTKTIDRNPTDDVSWFNRGTTKLKLLDFAGASADLSKSLELHPDDAYALYFRAIAQYNNNERSGAIADVLKALDIDPKLKFEHRDDDPIYQGVHDYIFKIIDYTNALIDNPFDEDVIMERAKFKESARDFLGANNDYSKVIKLNSFNSKAYFKRGYSKFYHLGDKTGAHSDFDESIRLNPDDAETYLFRSSVKESLGNHEGAIGDLSAIIVMYDPNAPECDQEVDFLDTAYETRGQIKDSLGDHKGAIEDFTSVITLDPKSYFSYAYRAKSKISIRDYLGAIEDSSVAININPVFEDSMIPVSEEAYAYRGRAKFELKDFEGAILDLNEALKINPDCAEALQYINAHIR